MGDAPELKSIEAATLCCSFCFAEPREVGRMAVGPDLVCICNVCVGLCVEILREGRVDRVRAGEAEYLSWGAA